MDGLSAFKETVVKILADDFRLSGAIITPEYPAVIRDHAIKRPCIAVGIDSVEMSAGLGGYIGTSPGGEVYGQVLSITMRLDIFTPADKPFDPYGFMDIICDIFMLSQNSLGFTRLWGDGISYDKDAEANRLTVKACMNSALTFKDNSGMISSFRLEKRR